MLILKNNSTNICAIKKKSVPLWYKHKRYKHMLYCVIAISRVFDDNQFRKFIKRSEIAPYVVRVYRPHYEDLLIKVPFASVPRVLRFLKQNVIQYCVERYV